MISTLKTLEEKIKPFGAAHRLSEEVTSRLPKKIRLLYTFQLFGYDALSVPGSVMLPNDPEVFEHPFRFVESEEEWTMFEQEFRPEVPNDYLLLGSFYNGPEPVVYHEQTNAVYTFHVSDVADKKWLDRKLKNQLATLDEFVSSLIPQTVACYIDPADRSKFDLFEIRNETWIKTNEGTIRTFDSQDCWNKYIGMAKASINKGYELHYAPQKLLQHLLS